MTDFLVPPSIPPASSNDAVRPVSTVPLVLDPMELEAMPPALHEALQSWVAQHRATRAQLPWHERVHPPVEASLEELGLVLVRTVAGMAPVSALGDWLRTYQARRYTRGGSPLLHPIDLVAAAVATRRLDVLTTVLDVPAFCPVERERARWITLAGPTPEHTALVARHGKAWFNGGLAASGQTAVRTDGWGRAFTALSAAYERDPLLPHDDPLWSWVMEHKPTDQAWARRFQTFPKPEASTVHRVHPHVNVVGMATMMGWGEGVMALLDHGIDPYARDTAATSQAQFMSPVILAAHHQEVDVLVALLRHPTFDPLHRYGYSHSEWARLKEVSTSDGLLWDSTNDEPGGFDLRFVLEQPALMGNDGVRRALRTTYDRLKPAQRARLNNTLPPVAARAWEGVALDHTVHACLGEHEAVIVARRARL